ncbi:MAG: DUF6318 family protein [Nostocoides sp.]
MVSWLRIGGGGVIVAVMVLSGCGGDDQVGPTTGTGTVSRSAASASTPTSTTPPSPTPGQVPAAARQHTNAGAEAFVRYYLDELSRAWMTPQTGLLPPLSLSTCKSCRANEEAAAEFVADREHVDRAVFAAKSVRYREQGDGQTAVVAAGTQTGLQTLDTSGRVVTSRTAKPLTLVFHLEWAGEGWKVEEVKIG